MIYFNILQITKSMLKLNVLSDVIQFSTNNKIYVQITKSMFKLTKSIFKKPNLRLDNEKYV